MGNLRFCPSLWHVSDMGNRPISSLEVSSFPQGYIPLVVGSRFWLPSTSAADHAQPPAHKMPTVLSVHEDVEGKLTRHLRVTPETKSTGRLQLSGMAAFFPFINYLLITYCVISKQHCWGICFWVSKRNKCIIKKNEKCHEEKLRVWVTGCRTEQFHMEFGEGLSEEWPGRDSQAGMCASLKLELMFEGLCRLDMGQEKR